MRKGTLIYSLVLLLILGIAIILMPAGAETITGSAKFDPNEIDLALPDPSVVKATIRLDEPPGPPSSLYKDINASTILLEGSLPPDTTYFISGGLVAEFDGTAVVNIIWGKIYHIGALTPPYKIWLTITGNMNDGTPFSVQGYIKITVPHGPPPP